MSTSTSSQPPLLEQTQILTSPKLETSSSSASRPTSIQEPISPSSSSSSSSSSSGRQLERLQNTATQDISSEADFPIYSPLVDEGDRNSLINLNESSTASQLSVIEVEAPGIDVGANNDTTEETGEEEQSDNIESLHHTAPQILVVPGELEDPEAPVQENILDANVVEGDRPLPPSPPPPPPPPPLPQSFASSTHRHITPTIAQRTTLATNSPISISVTGNSNSQAIRNYPQYRYSSLIPRDEPLSASRGSPLSPTDWRQRPSDSPLPLWQPDADVNSCPICGNTFTIFYRRHHCRKCGRVVCAPCSPHRINIPKSFVVSPPSTIAGPSESPVAPLNTTEGPERRDFESGDAAVEVRICETCLAGENESSRRRRRRTTDSIIPPAGSPGGAGRFWENDTNDIDFNSGRQRSNIQDAQFRHQAYISPLSPQNYSRSLERSSFGNVAHHPGISHSRSVSAQLPHTNYSSGGFQGSGSRQDFVAQPPPQRLKETDYCPICTLPLPPPNDDGDETAREEHILDCIRLVETSVSPHGGGARRGLTTSAQSTPGSHSPAVNTMSMFSEEGFPSPSPARSLPSALDGPNFDGRTRRVIGGRGGRMVVYKATDKDTLAFNGDAEADSQRAECVICFEEFEIGDAIARLECLCRYHKTCIWEWFDRKGNGECPVHAVHE